MVYNTHEDSSGLGRKITGVDGFWFGPQNWLRVLTGTTRDTRHHRKVFIKAKQSHK